MLVKENLYRRENYVKKREGENETNKPLYE
jgi:hypothetical protein